ncbi:phosphatidylinositol-glycan biosynthesis class X protein-like [Homarus americanus]|nr:phosphatidylinositol-glycan biosynthesis class X protein-like [Homarus americanus]XP_042239665.1 phosphatidylinositol-glycan biosynthesis class X protein-like [Homarus americanus]XP_042239666.1 phosphatidylinositol-glycan biosynthesis class X protein-like [Homarus americanus]XP_042239667.1 phosphatidylinositol-glycan biosynthesis class X protein-like [Homarus americanus]
MHRNSLLIKKMACVTMLATAFVVISLVPVSWASTCPLVLKTNAQVERRLLNEGFHRDLETTVFLSSPEDLQSCLVLIKEVLPPGSYVDPNQLRFLRAFGGPDFHVPQIINVETPEHLSPRVLAYFYILPQPMSDGRWLVNITVPIHLRYHRARSGESYSLEVPVRLQHPAVLVQCEDVGGDACRPLVQLEPCPPSGVQLCEWLPVNTFSTSEAVMGIVPVGNTDLLDTVLLTTTCITAGATLLILATLRKK